jgi:hypothetical protein
MTGRGGPLPPPPPQKKTFWLRVLLPCRAGGGGPTRGPWLWRMPLAKGPTQGGTSVCYRLLVTHRPPPAPAPPPSSCPCPSVPGLPTDAQPDHRCPTPCDAPASPQTQPPASPQSQARLRLKVSPRLRLKLSSGWWYMLTATFFFLARGRCVYDRATVNGPKPKP